MNELIRTSNVFHAMLDFDKVLRDHLEPSQLASKYDLGDHLHPNVEAYHALVHLFFLF